jgi:hypothetical protein
MSLTFSAAMQLLRRSFAHSAFPSLRYGVLLREHNGIIVFEAKIVKTLGTEFRLFVPVCGTGVKRPPPVPRILRTNPGGLFSPAVETF